MFTTRLAIIAAFLYYIRKYWMSPWARYVSHIVTKENGYFLTVKHVHWYPPFLEYEATYHRFPNKEYMHTVRHWANTETGYVPNGTDATYSHSGRQLKLDGILQAAIARDAETRELIGL